MTCFSVKSGHISPHIVIKEAFLLKSTYLDDGQNITSEPLLNLAATLASHGYINEEKISWPQAEGLQLKLVNLDVSSVPAADLASLARCARDLVMLFNVTGDVTPLINSAKCRELDIRKNSEVESLALVTAMVGNVKSLLLGNEVTLDMETLAQYDGKGECEKVTMWADTRERYRDQVKEWAGSMGWAVSRDKPSRQDRSSVGGYIVIQRNCN